MKLPTTLNYDQSHDKLESKIFKIQIIYKIDGDKNSIEKDIDAVTFYKNKDVHTIKITDQPETHLLYRVHIFFKEERQRRSNFLQIPTNSLQLDQKKNINKSAQNFEISNHSNKSPSKNLSISNCKSVNYIRFQKDDSEIQKFLTEKKSKRKPNSGDKKGDELDFYIQNSKAFQLKQKKFEKVEHQLKTQQEQINTGVVTQQLKNNVLSLKMQLDQKVQQLQKTNTKHTQLELKYKDLSVKFQKILEKYSQISEEKKKFELLNQQNSNTIDTLNQTMNSKEKEMLEKSKNFEKQAKKFKSREHELLEKLQDKQSQNKKLSAEIKSQNQLRKVGESKIKELNEQYRKLEETIESSKTNCTASLQESLKPYKDRIRTLERQNEDLREEKDFEENDKKAKNDEIFQLRQKIKLTTDENLQYLQQISTQKYQIEKLNKKIQNLAEEIKTLIDERQSLALNVNETREVDEQNSDFFDNILLKGQGQKAIGNSMAHLKRQNNELKTKLSILAKNLQSKDNLLKKFESFSKEDKKEIEEQLAILKSENQQLKQQLKSDNEKDKSSLSKLQEKMQLQKTKKELQYKTKSSKQLLLEKSQLESRNKALQDEVVKSKQSIANILNVIQQFGDERLISEATMFLG